MHVVLSLALLSVLQSAGETGLVVLENLTAEPFVYRFHFGYEPGKQDPWTRQLVVPAGQRRTIGTPVPLQIGFRDGDQWQTYALPPGRGFRWKLDAQGRAGLFVAGTPSAPRQDIREIKVLAVADAEYRYRFPDWQERVGGLVAAASRFYEAELGIRLSTAGFQPWQFNARYHRSLHEKLESLQKIDRGQADLVVAMIRCVSEMNAGVAIGWSPWLSQYVVVVDSYPELADITPLAYREHIWKIPGFGSTVTLVHELAHTLGGFHVDDRESILYPQTTKIIPPRIQFDDVNREVILATRNADFRRGPDSVPREAALRIRELYRQHHVPSEPAAWDPISSAYRWRATMAGLSNNRALADEMTRRAETWWRDAR